MDTGTAGTRITRIAAMNACDHALKGLDMPDVRPGHRVWEALQGVLDQC